MGKKAGKDFKAYRGASALGSADASSGDWTEMSNLQNLTSTRSRDQFEANTRGNSGYKSYMTGLKDAQLSFTMLYDDTDADLTAIEAAWDGDTAIAFADMDGDIDEAGSRGIAGNWKVSQFDVEEPLDGPATVSVTLSADSYTHLYTVAS